MIQQLFLIFAKVGTFAFGGGYAMIPLFQRELVARTHWVTPARFADMVVLSQATPGPIATSAGTIVGYWKAGLLGAVVATFAVMLPAMIIVWLLARTVARHGNLSWLQSVFSGLRPVVVALVAVAALSLAKGALPNWWSGLIAVATVVAVGHFRVHPIAAILSAGLLGILFM